MNDFNIKLSKMLKLNICIVPDYYYDERHKKIIIIMEENKLKNLFCLITFFKCCLLGLYYPRDKTYENTERELICNTYTHIVILSALRLINYQFTL
jgi:hypothetical protein